MALISASRITDLKARVKAECTRRATVGNASGSASVSSYGGTSYDYTNTPAAGVIIAQEHRTKIATPLNAINANIVATANSGQSKITDSDITSMEAFVTTLETRSATDSSGTDCKGGCTGLCYGCSSTCTSTCTGSCTGSCSGCTSCSGCSGCTWACQDTCYNWCAGYDTSH